LFRAAENKTFEAQFAACATLLGNVLNNGLKDNLANAQFLADTLGLMGTTSGWQWPNVTIPRFANWSTSAIEAIVHVDLVSFAPVVPNAQLAGYNAYACAQGVALQSTSVSAYALRVMGALACGLGVHTFNASGSFTPSAPLAPSFTVPVWQTAPLAGYEGTALFDLHTLPNSRPVIDSVMATGVAAVTDVVLLSADSQGVVSSGKLAFQASSAVYAAVKNATGTIVGLLILEFAWCVSFFLAVSSLLNLLVRSVVYGAAYQQHAA